MKVLVPFNILLRWELAFPAMLHHGCGINNTSSCGVSKGVRHQERAALQNSHIGFGVAVGQTLRQRRRRGDRRNQFTTSLQHTPDGCPESASAARDLDSLLNGSNWMDVVR